MSSSVGIDQLCLPAMRSIASLFSEKKVIHCMLSFSARVEPQSSLCFFLLNAYNIEILDFVSHVEKQNSLLKTHFLFCERLENIHDQNAQIKTEAEMMFLYMRRYVWPKP